MAVEVRQSSIHGRGCFASTAIAAGTRIIEYIGRRISLREANERYWERPSTYLLGLSDGTVIDGLGKASFINHCCDPNCRVEEDDGRVWVWSLCDIATGEELTFDYKLRNSGVVDMPCRCGARHCRGTMFSNEEVKKRHRRGQRSGLTRQKVRRRSGSARADTRRAKGKRRD
jgi:uncharacterized protein